MDKDCKERLNRELSEYLAGNLRLSSEERSRADGILWELRDEWMYRWHRTWERGLVSEILQFGISMQNLGRERNVPLLTLYGRELEAAVMDFSVSDYECYLEAYPHLIRVLGGKFNGQP